MGEIGMSLLLVLISVGSLTGNDQGSAGGDYSVVTISFLLVWVLFFVASAMTIISQLPRFKAQGKLVTEALDNRLMNVAAQLSMQEENARNSRETVLRSLSWYDANALRHALKLLSE